MDDYTLILTKAEHEMLARVIATMGEMVHVTPECLINDEGDEETWESLRTKIW